MRPLDYSAIRSLLSGANMSSPKCVYGFDLLLAFRLVGVFLPTLSGGIYGFNEGEEGPAFLGYLCGAILANCKFDV